MRSMLELILEEVPPDKAEQFKRWVETQKGVTRATEEIEKVKKSLATAEAKLKEVRDKCKHDRTKNGECQICGAEVS